jgi:hypothetical protein
LLIQVIVQRDPNFLRVLETDCDEGRPKDSAANLKPGREFEPEVQILYTFRRAAESSAQLSNNPKLLMDVLRVERAGDRNAEGQSPGCHQQLSILGHKPGIHHEVGSRNRRSIVRGQEGDGARYVLGLTETAQALLFQHHFLEFLKRNAFSFYCVS